MQKNQFFLKKGPFSLRELIKVINCTIDFSKKNIQDYKIYNVESLDNATDKDITFLNSAKYKDFSIKTKAAACITTSNLSKFLPNECIKLNVKNVFLAMNEAMKMFYLLITIILWVF